MRLEAQPVKRYSDTRYAELFSHPYFVQGLLTHFVDEEFVRELDFSDMEPCKNTLVTETYAKRESDVIWRIRFRGRDVYLFILIEFQSTVDKRMPIRLLRYIAKLYDTFGGTRPGGEAGLRPAGLPGIQPGTPAGKQTACLYPPVFPIVLYNGKRPWQAARETADLIEPLIPPGYIPHLRYYLIEERSFSPDMLAGIRSLVALLFLAEALPPEEIALSMDAFFDIIKSEDSNAVALFGRWINDYFRQVAGSDADAPRLDFRTGEEPSMLAENLRIWRKKNIKEGVKQGRQEVAERLLQRGMSLADVAEIARLSPEEIVSVSGVDSSKG
jgi:hypothetical protein